MAKYVVPKELLPLLRSRVTRQEVQDMLDGGGYIITVPPATTTAYGGFKLGIASSTLLKMGNDGVLYVDGESLRNYLDTAGYITSVAFSDLTSHPTTISGYGITDASISNGTITLGSNSITPIVANDLGTAAYKNYTESIADDNFGLPTSDTVYSYINAVMSSSMKNVGVSTTAITNGGSEIPTIDGQPYTPNVNDVVFYDVKEYVWTSQNKWRELGDEGSFALKTTSITAGTGLTGGGDLSTSRTLSLSDATQTDIGQGVTAYGWGNHADAGYVTDTTGFKYRGDYSATAGAKPETDQSLYTTNNELCGSWTLKFSGSSGHLFQSYASGSASYIQLYAYYSQTEPLRWRVSQDRNLNKPWREIYDNLTSYKIQLINYAGEASGYRSLAAGASAYAKGDYSSAFGYASQAGLRSGDENKPYVYMEQYTPEAITYNGSTVYGIWLKGNETATFTYNGTQHSVTTPSTTANSWRALNVVKITGDILVPQRTTFYWYKYYVITDSGLQIGDISFEQVTKLEDDLYALVSYGVNTNDAWKNERPMATSATKIGLWTKVASNTYAGTYAATISSHSVGYASRSVTFGGNSVAGINALTLGYNSIAKGSNSMAGSYAVATGSNSLALGSFSSTISDGAVALGYISSAKGVYSLATGYRSLATSRHAMALGAYSKAQHDGALVQAYNGLSGANFQTVLGIYNQQVSGQALVVGWGTAENDRKNIMTLSTAGALTASSFKVPSGLATQFLKADGTLDSNTYALDSALGDYLPLTAGSGKALTGDLYFDASSASRNISWKDINNNNHFALTLFGDGNLGIGYSQQSIEKSTLIKGRNVRLFTGTSTTPDAYQIELDYIGNFYPLTGSIKLGTSSKPWSALYATTLYGNLALSYLQNADDLKAIEALTGTGIAKRTADNTWTLTDDIEATNIKTSTESDAEFTYRKSPSTAIGDMAKVLCVKGNTIVWNQFIKNSNSIAFDIDNNSGSVSYAILSSGNILLPPSKIVTGHRYYRKLILDLDPNYDTYSTFYWSAAQSTLWGTLTPGSSVITSDLTTTHSTDTPLRVRALPAYTHIKGTITLITVDLTLMGLDSITTPEEFEALYPELYYDYNAEEPVSNKVAAIETTGWNQWDEEWEGGGINNDTGQDATASTQIRSKNYVSVYGNTDYYVKSAAEIYLFEYDANKNFIGRTSASGSYNVINKVVHTSSNCCYVRFKSVQTTYNHDICINLSNQDRNGTYEPYKKDTVELNITDLVPANKPTVRLNQHIISGTRTGGSASVTMAKSGTRYTFNGTATGTATFFLDTANDIDQKMPIGHKGYYSYRIVSGTYTGSWNVGSAYAGNTPLGKGTSIITTYSGAENYPYIYCTVGASASSLVIEAMCIDLTEMYGSGNEPTSTAEVEALIGAGYIPYNTGTDIANKIFPVGLKGIGTARDEASTNAVKRIGVVDLGTLKYTKSGDTYTLLFPDAKAPAADYLAANLITPKFENISRSVQYANTTPDSICISSSGRLFIISSVSYNTAAEFRAAMSGVYLYYELATPVTYTLALLPQLVASDPDGTQRQVPVMDAVSNGVEVFPEGPQTINSVKDEEHDRTAIKRIEKVDLGTLDWIINSTYGNFQYTLTDGKNKGEYSCSKYKHTNTAVASLGEGEMTTNLGSTGMYIAVKDSSYSTATEFKTAMSGVYLYYELATPVTYTLDNTLISAPYKGDFQYGVNVVDIYDEMSNQMMTDSDDADICRIIDPNYV